jgi:hypothetical protein
VIVLPKEIELDTATLADYVSKYRFNSSTIVDFTLVTVIRQLVAAGTPQHVG